MSIADLTLAEATALQRHWPSLTAHDWRVLAAIIDAAPEGLTYEAIRKDADYYGTSRKHIASLERLLAAGLIEKIGAQGRPVLYLRTAKPLEPTNQKPAPIQPAFVL